MRFRLRTLMILLALGPPVLAVAFLSLGQSLIMWFIALIIGMYAAAIAVLWTLMLLFGAAQPSSRKKGRADPAKDPLPDLVK